MKKIILAVLLICLFRAPGVVAAELTGAQISAICQTRSTCTVAKTYDGGKSPTGSALTVVDVHLGVKDKPDDAPDSGCRAEDKYDGGVEYWLVDGTAPPKRLLKLCNDGYGAAGIGEDEVSVGPNRLVHLQVGGSAWRWDSTVAFTLSPWRAVSERDCSFNDLSSNNCTVTDIDYLGMRARSIAKDAARKWGENVGCPEWPSSASRHFTPEPARGLLGAYDVLVPVLGRDGDTPKIPSGTAIGDCVAAMTTGGANGFIVFGRPAPAGRAAEIRVVAESLNSLLIQVFDPVAGGPFATFMPQGCRLASRSPSEMCMALPQRTSYVAAGLRISAGGGNATGRFPSGQRGQTVNLLATPSKVRILLSPEGLPHAGVKALLVSTHS